MYFIELIDDFDVTFIKENRYTILGTEFDF
jgi:hypothetical protein